MNDLIQSGRETIVPSEFQLLPYGEIELEGEGSAFLDSEMMDQIINHFESRGNDMVIDYEHQTLKDTQAPAAGWVKQLVNRGKQGLWAVVKWTDKAKRYLMNGEYRYFSPVFYARNSDRKIVSVVNVGLTNFPKINHLNPIMAKSEHHDPDLFEATLRIAKGFNLSEEDIRKYGGTDSDPDETSESSIMTVAKLMGNTEEDIRKYGGTDSDPDETSESSIMTVAKRMGNTEEDIRKYGGTGTPCDYDSNEMDKPPILQVAKLMGNTEEDIKTSGGLQ